MPARASATQAALMSCPALRTAGSASNARSGASASLASEALAPLRALLAAPAVRKAGHDIKAAWVAFARAGISLAGVAYDSMVASFVLDPGNRSHAINDLAREHLSVELPTSASLLGKGKGGTERTYSQVPPAEAARV